MSQLNFKVNIFYIHFCELNFKIIIAYIIRIIIVYVPLKTLITDNYVTYIYLHQLHVVEHPL